MKKEMNVAEFVRRFVNGAFENPSRETQIEAGWYDWFCKDEALARKTRQLGEKVRLIADSGRFDKTKTYVFFKNNCPCLGPLYDDFRICDLKTGNVLFCCQHLQRGSHGCDKEHWELYDFTDGYDNPKEVNGTWRDVYNYFMNAKK